MPSTLPRQEPIPEFENRIRWTRKQCGAIERAGILFGRYELIDGEILTKLPENPPHGICVQILRDWLIMVFGGIFVRIQTSIEVGDADPEHNDPEPDAAVTIEPRTSFLTLRPGPENLHLVIEVSDSTIRSDLAAKALVYGRAEIREYWIVDIQERRIVVHREPQPDGYARIAAYAADEFVSPLARPDALVRVSDLLTPVA